MSAEPSRAGNAPLRFDDATVPLKLVAVATPVTTTPALNVGAPVPALLVILSALSLPPPPASIPGVWTSELIPKISGIKSSPSPTIKSAPDSTAISWYCV